MGRFQWFRMLIESTGTFDVWGTISRVFHYLLVEIPFALQRLLVSIIALIISMLDFSSLFARHRQVAFDHSRTIWLSFIGHENGHISNGSVAFFFVLIATIYLAWQFFFSRNGDFGKKALHMLLVVTLGFAYFGTWQVNGTPTPGGIVMLDTLDNVSRDIREALLIDFAPVGVGQVGSLTGQGDFASFYEAHVIGTTFNFINSGSMSGEYAPGQFLDMERLIPPDDLQERILIERAAWLRIRDNYIDDLAGRNPWVQANMNFIVPRMMMVLLGFVNALILAIPIIYVNLTLTAFELINWLLILFFPFALMISFIPFLRGVVFKVLKTMVIISFVPVLLGFLLLIFFYLNQVIDTIILEVAHQVLNVGSMNMNTLPNGIAGLAVFALMIVVKIFLFHGAWKNKTALLGFITAGAVSPQVMVTVDAPTEMMKDYAQKPMEYMESKVDAAKKTIGGFFTGDVESVEEGVNEFVGEKEEATVEDVEVEKENLSALDVMEIGEDEANTNKVIIEDVVSDHHKRDVHGDESLMNDGRIDHFSTDNPHAPINHLSTISERQTASDDIMDVNVLNVDEMGSDREALAFINEHETFHDFMTGRETILNGKLLSEQNKSEQEMTLRGHLTSGDQLQPQEVNAPVSRQTKLEQEITLRDHLTSGDQLQPQEMNALVVDDHQKGKTEMELFVENMDRMRRE